MPSNKPLINFVIDPEMRDRIDKFRWKEQFETRAAAIKWLLDWALDQNPSRAQKPPKSASKKRS